MKDNILQCNQCKETADTCYVKALACTARNRQIANMIYCPLGYWGEKPEELEEKIIRTLVSSTNSLVILRITINQVLKTHGLKRKDVKIKTKKREDGRYNVFIIKKREVDTGE